MDAAVASLLGALGVAFLSSVTAIVVAIINNRKERTGSAGAGIEAVLRQQLEFGEDRLEAAGLELARKNELIAELRARLDRCTCEEMT